MNIVVLVYADDIPLISKDSQLIAEVKQELMKTFKMKDLGPAKSFLIVNIRKTRDGFTLDQTGYIEKLLETHEMTKKQIRHYANGS